MPPVQVAQDSEAMQGMIHHAYMRGIQVNVCNQSQKCTQCRLLCEERMLIYKPFSLVAGGCYNKCYYRCFVKLI